MLRPVPGSGVELASLSQEALEELHISYHCWEGSLAPTMERAESLLSAFHFTCACTKCQDEGLDRAQWTGLREECERCQTPLAPNLDEEEDWRDPLKQPNVVFLYPLETTLMQLYCPSCGHSVKTKLPMHRFYAAMRSAMLASFAIDCPYGSDSSCRDSHLLYQRLLEAEETLHTTKNAWIFLAREVRDAE